MWCIIFDNMEGNESIFKILKFSQMMYIFEHHSLFMYLVLVTWFFYHCFHQIYMELWLRW
jgi:hypothetical protein